jgi:hypothetical protein
MQLTLAFLKQPDQGPAKSLASTPWDRLDEASRIAALAILARLMAQMLTSRPEKVAGND